jgi:AAA+ superfamily predicted ATPase
MPTPDKRDELRLLVHSRHPILAVETAEERRVEELLAQVAAELSIPFFVWTVTQGLARRGTSQAIYNTEDPEQALANVAAIRGDGIFLLKDFARYLTNDRILRRMRELAADCREMRRSIVLSAAAIELPAELAGVAVPFHLELPDARVLLRAVTGALGELGAQGVKVELDGAGQRELAEALVGLTVEQARRVVMRAGLARRCADRELIADARGARHDALKQEGILEYIETDLDFSAVAGLARLKDWLRKRRGALTAEGKKFGLEPPKGVLITGVQGCGKSLAAKAVAAEWKLPLARLDAGSLYDKYIGESEKRLRRALALAEKLAPIVIWMDELEKAFAAGRSEADAGLSQRILGAFLTWLQDRESGVFLVATSNDISALPPELVRKGRFDEIFFVDLPDEAARRELFAIHLRRRGRKPEEFDLAALAAATDGFSGAEVEQLVVSGLYSAFSQEQKLSTEILLAEARETRPLSVTRAETIAALRAWARERAAPAD